MGTSVPSEAYRGHARRSRAGSTAMLAREQVARCIAGACVGEQRYVRYTPRSITRQGRSHPHEAIRGKGSAVEFARRPRRRWLSTHGTARHVKELRRMPSLCFGESERRLWVELWVALSRKDGIHIWHGLPANICLTLSPPVKLLRRSRRLSGHLAKPCWAAELGVPIFLPLLSAARTIAHQLGVGNGRIWEAPSAERLAGSA